MTADTGASSNELRRNSLGLIAVTFMVISAAAPLTGVAGAVPIAFLIGNGTGVPATFIAMTLIMLAFSVGYVAMSRHVRNAGAFYAYAARGLGGYAGGATAFMALVAYNAMQFGLIGLLGGVATGVFGQFGINLAKLQLPDKEAGCPHILPAKTQVIQLVFKLYLFALVVFLHIALGQGGKNVYHTRQFGLGNCNGSAYLVRGG